MFKRILVGFDESESSRDALELGRKLSAQLGAELVLVGVVPSPTGGSLISALPADAFANLVEQAREGLERFAAELGAATEIVESSSAARGLEELTEKLEGDLVVLGSSRAEDGMVRAGHKARVLLQGSPVAVALAPVGYRSRQGRIAAVGAGVDGSPESTRALQAAVEVAGAAGSVRLISVADDFAEVWGFWGATYAIAELGDASRQKARDYLSEAAELVPDSVEAESVMLEGPAAEELRRQSEAGLDLLCLGSRGYGPVRRVLLGSVTSELFRKVACPVMILPRG